VYVEKEDLQGEDGWRRISLSMWKRAGRAAVCQASERRNVRATQRSRFGHHRAASFCSPHSSPLPRSSPSMRAVTTCWSPPQRGRSELLTSRPTGPHLRGSEGLHGMRMTRRRWRLVSPLSHTVRAPRRPARQRTLVLTPRATVSCPLHTFASLPVRRPPRTGARGGAIFGALSVDSRAMDPPATPPGRRQPAPDASAGRGRGGDLTPPTTSHPARPAATTTEKTTRRPVLADRATQPGQEPERGGRGCTRSMVGKPVQRLKQQTAGQYGHAESASPGAGPRNQPRGATLRREQPAQPRQLLMIAPTRTRSTPANGWPSR
jgi:hypothetical protein